MQVEASKNSLIVYSKKILWNVLFACFTVRGYRLEYLVVVLEVLVELQYGSDIPTSVAVVRGRPDSHQSIREYFFVAFHHQLVGSADQINVV